MKAGFRSRSGKGQIGKLLWRSGASTVIVIVEYLVS